MSKLTEDQDKCEECKKVTDYNDLWEYEGELLCYECYNHKLQYTFNDDY
jgi:formylmethanofuran dehydrogenase subunit E